MNYNFDFDKWSLVKNNENFSNTQINNIIEKLNNIEKEERDNQENRSNTLIQGNFKAEYFSNNFDCEKGDYINVTINNNRYKLSGVFNPKDTINKNWKNEESDSFNNCIKDPANKFNYFDHFSPSGYYLGYYYNLWSIRKFNLVDIKTGKIFLNEEGVHATTWTNDRKQFIFGKASEYTGDKGLFITKIGSFPQYELILDQFISSMYVDENYIYVKSYHYDNSLGFKNNLYILDLKNYEVVYSKNI